MQRLLGFSGDDSHDQGYAAQLMTTAHRTTRSDAFMIARKTWKIASVLIKYIATEKLKNYLIFERKESWWLPNSIKRSSD
jgi:hypothetical protein